MAKLGFTARLRVILFIALVGLVVLGAWSAFQGRNVMMKEREQGVRNLVESAQGIVETYAALEKKGTMTREAAQKAALAQLNSMKYGEDGYMFVFNSQPTVLMIGNEALKKLENQNVSDRKDAEGNYYYREFVDKGNNGGGYVNYVSNRPDTGEAEAKISYVSKFSDWDWYICSGVFLGDVQHAFYKILLSCLAMIVVVGGAVCVVMLWTIRSTRRSLGGEPEYAQKIIEEVAQGHLDTTIALRRNDSDSLLSTVDKMQRQLGAMVLDVRQGANAMQTAFQEIAAGNDDLSQRTEEQASSLQETAASMEQLTATVKMNADNARTASEMATSARESSAQTNQKVGEAVRTMKQVNDQVAHMGDIISSIESIAFQTNILALNAAVEAARAGSEGKGFAVVAGEVGALAKRSASAAKEIKEMITHSTTSIVHGGKLVEQVGESMSQVMAAISRVSDIVSEISGASSEQSKGIEQVNDAMTQMDQVTQQNAALVEQSAAATSSLRDQALALQGAVSGFRLA